MDLHTPFHSADNRLSNCSVEVNRQRFPQTKYLDGEIDDFRNLPSSQPISLVAIASKSSNSRRKGKGWRPMTDKELGNDPLEEPSTAVETPNNANNTCELVTVHVSKPSQLSPQIANNPDPNSSPSEGQVEPLFGSSRLLDPNSLDIFELHPLYRMDAGSGVYGHGQPQGKPLSSSAQHDAISIAQNQARAATVDRNAQFMATLDSQGRRRMSYNPYAPVGIQQYQTVPYPYCHPAYQGYNTNTHLHHQGRWQPDPRTHGLPVNDQIALHRIPPHIQQISYPIPHTALNRGFLPENMPFRPDNKAVHPGPHENLLSKTAKTLSKAIDSQVQQDASLPRTQETTRHQDPRADLLAFGDLPLELKYKNSVELASLGDMNINLSVGGPNKWKPLGITRDASQINYDLNSQIPSYSPSAVVSSGTASAIQPNPSKVAVSLTSPTSSRLLGPFNQPDEAKVANNSGERMGTIAGDAGQQRWETPSWWSIREPNPFCKKSETNPGRMNTFPETVPVWKPEDYMSFQPTFGKRHGIYAMDLPVKRAPGERPLIGDTRGLLERPASSLPCSGLQLRKDDQLSSSNIPLPPGLKPPPGLVHPGVIDSSNNLGEVKPLESLEAKNAAYNRQRASVSEDWFKTSDANTDDAFRQHLLFIAEEEAVRLKNAGEKRPVVERNGRILDANTLLWGDVLATMRSYVVDRPPDRINYLANFGSVRDECIEPSHGGRRSYFDTDPNANKWRAPAGTADVVNLRLNPNQSSPSSRSEQVENSREI